MAKAWKYYNNVPMSSFYLEMRAAHYINTGKFWDPIQDVARYFAHLKSVELGPMNDPKGLTKRFYACSSTAKGAEALSKVDTAATRVNKALEASKADKLDDAFYYLDLLFGGNFPPR